MHLVDFCPPHAKALQPGETREFTTALPVSFDADDAVDLGKFGAAVGSLRCSPPQ